MKMETTSGFFTIPATQQKLKMNKKGFLLGEETLKIIIAVICIGFLVYLIAAVYFSVSDGQKSKEAEASLTNVISTEITRINSGGEYNQQGVHIPNPSGWYIFGFVGNVKKPNQCTEQNCICVCRAILINLFDRQIKQCDEKGSCLIVSNLNDFEKIKIEKDGVFISVIKLNENIEISKK